MIPRFEGGCSTNVNIYRPVSVQTITVQFLFSVRYLNKLYIGFPIPVLNDNPGNPGFFSKFPGI